MMKSLSKIPYEWEEQKAFIVWFKLQYKNHIIFSIPNEGQRSLQGGKMFKDTGLLKGIPDLCILTPCGRTIFLEMKRRKRSYLSKQQKEIHSKLKEMNFVVIVGFGFEDAKTKILELL